MYEQGLSLANIQKVIKGGVALPYKKSYGKYGKNKKFGGLNEGDKMPQPDAAEPPTAAVPAAAEPATADTAAEPTPTDAAAEPAAAEAGMETGAGTAIADMNTKQIKNVYNTDIINACADEIGLTKQYAALVMSDVIDSYNINLDDSFINTGLKKVLVATSGLLVSWISFCVFFFYFIMSKNRSLLKISTETRYNKDLPEYELTRNPNKINIKSKLFITVVIPPFVTILSGIIIGLSKHPKSPYKNIKHIWIVFILSFITSVLYIIVYVTQMNKIKIINDNINKFEKFVYQHFYINTEFLNILYNNGTLPENPDTLIKVAADTALQKRDSNSKNLDRDRILKIIYTLNMYKYFQTDVINNIPQKRIYKMETLQLFNMKLIGLPGKSRIFKVADYMRSDIPGNLDNKNNLNTVFTIVNGILKLDQNTAQNIKYESEKLMSDTKKYASRINIRSAWKNFKIMMITVTVLATLILLTVIIIAIIGLKTLKQLKFLNCVQTQNRTIG